ncbi:MAG: GspE/PulE family protein [Patescibacteria group bacterium]
MAFTDYLAQKGVMSSQEADKLLAEAGESGESVDALLIRRGIEEPALLELKSEYYKTPFKKIDPESVPTELFQYIPEEAALHYQFVPLGMANGVLEVGIVDPDNIEARDALQFISSKTGLPFKIFLISTPTFEGLISQYKGLSGQVRKALSEFESPDMQNGEGKAAVDIGEIETPGTEKEEPEASEEAPPKEFEEAEIPKAAALPTAKGVEDLSRIVEEAPVSKIVGVILRHAVEGRASDIHIEPTADKLRVRFRIDGVLFTSLQLPLSVHRAVVARIKVLANLKLDERRKPQDGRFLMKFEGRRIDLRVSTFPTFFGEKVEMRILDLGSGLQALGETGLTETDMKALRTAITRPYGMILLTGPTGSGKTTTLRAMINELDREKQNIVTLEDPVEYNIEGVSQSQVRPEIGYTFASGLRHILRQDPDVIMVGEIRDKETAELAIQAALTGHLVFSTLHTNTAIGVVPRLVDMGIDPYLIAPTILVAVAQRLAKVICPDAKKEVPVDGGIKIMIEKQFADLPQEFRKKIPEIKTVYDAVPTADCPGGTRGRIGVFEILPISKEIREVILKSPSEAAIYKIAREQGMLTMKEDAILKSSKGIIPFSEVNAL